MLYLAAENRLSNEFVDTIGCAPATRLGAAGAGAGADVAAAVSVTVGFEGGCAAACLVSVFCAEAFAASWRGGLASAAFGLAAAGWDAVAVVSAVPPRPTLRARLEKKLSDWVF